MGFGDVVSNGTGPAELHTPVVNNLIAFCSNGPRAGKSTAADVLVNEFGFQRIKFAETLKEMVATFMRPLFTAGTSFHHLLETDDKDKPFSPELPDVTPRHLMVTLGTDWGRRLVRDDVWVIVTRKRIADLLAQGQRVVVDDMRFPNELAAIKKLNGTTAYIFRPGFTLSGTCEGLINYQDCDYTYGNETTRENLQWWTRILAQCQAVRTGAYE